jgi:hypothetical protein
VDVYAASGYLHSLDVDSAADVSKIISTFILSRVQV